jgi:hypothetical protein
MKFGSLASIQAEGWTSRIYEAGRRNPKKCDISINSLPRKEGLLGLCFSRSITEGLEGPNEAFFVVSAPLHTSIQDRTSPSPSLYTVIASRANRHILTTVHQPPKGLWWNQVAQLPAKYAAKRKFPRRQLLASGSTPAVKHDSCSK